MGLSFSTQYFIKNPSVYATKVGETTENIRTYDYVIVGGGPAACVLAHRLTENPNVTVILIESGEQHHGHLYSRIPATFPKTFKTNIDWAYTTTKQVNTDNRSMSWPAGKVVGGGSMINALMYQRPCADDINEWVRLGATGWGWKDDFQRYCIKAEKYTLHPDRPNPEASYRGSTGHWLTSNPPRLPISAKFVDTCEHIGIPRIMDICRPEGPIGVSFTSGWIDPKGERCSAAHAYLKPAVLARPNLTIAVNTTVTRIVFSTSTETPRAIGVELANGPDTPLYQLHARREVLCCAGAIKTPQILMLSGVGPAEELHRLNIPVVKALPAVGKNLYDHLVTTVAFRAKPGTTMDSLVTPIGGIIPLVRWLSTGGGPFASHVGQALVFVKSTDTKLPFDRDAEPSKVVDVSAGDASPDLEYIGAPVMFKSHGQIPAPQGANIFTIATVLLRPQSNGTITLRSSSIWDGADIDPNYFAVKSDMDTFVRGVRLSLRMARSEPLVDQLLLQENAEESDIVYYPGHVNPDDITDEALQRYIRRAAETLYHPMSTARIGHSQTDSVVDHELRVHGVSNLRIVDTSVFPTPFAGHPCATVIALGEKAADMLKATQH